MIERLEWISGPALIVRREARERQGVLKAIGPLRRLLVGQLRDKELGHVHGWAMESPLTEWKTRVKIARLQLDVPLAKNWTPVLNKAFVASIPRGFTITPDGSPFERGLII